MFVLWGGVGRSYLNVRRETYSMDYHTASYGTCYEFALKMVGGCINSHPMSSAGSEHVCDSSKHLALSPAGSR